MSLGILHVQCPECSYRFSAHDRPRHKTKLLYTEVTCPQCGSRMRPGRFARVVTNTLLISVAVALGGLLVYGAAKDIQAIFIAAACLSIGGAFLILQRQPWEVVAKGDGARTAKVKKRKIPAAVSFSPAPLPDHMVVRFSAPNLSRFERHAGAVLGFAFSALFAYLARSAPHMPLAILFIGIAALSLGIGVVLLVRPPVSPNIEVDRNRIQWILGDERRVIAWDEIRGVTESFLLRRVTIVGRGGQRIALKYEIENFTQLRDILLERISGHFASLPPKKMYRRYSFALIVFGALGVGLVGSVALAVRLHAQIITGILVVLPVGLGFCFLALRQVYGVELGATGVKIRRHIGAAKSISYNEIRDVYIDENLDAFLAVRSVASRKRSPGLVITTHHGTAHAITMLTNGPMELYLAIKENLN